MLTPFNSIVLGFVQGMTEFLPISSSGHLIMARELLGISQEGGMAFDAILQLATAMAVALYFRKDLWGLFINLFKKKAMRDTKKTRLTWFLIVGTIPAVVLGLLLQEYMDSVFRSPLLVAVTLVAGALVMLVADKVLQKKKSVTSSLSVKKSIGIGLFQSLALIPGMSRSGMTISGGYILGISKELAIRFSFLLSVPIIVGSGLVKLIDIIQDPSVLQGTGMTLLYGALSAFIFGWIAIDFLLKFLKTHNFTGFIIYRIVLAGVVLLFLFI